MTTPTQSRGVSTPKPHLPSTPSRMMASPRPGTGGLAGKSLAHKSPAGAMKTPASAAGHLHGLSVSSQPSSTPLAAAAIHDELLNLNSPAAALINSIAQNNLTPLPVGQDALGISTHTPISTRDGPKDPESERLHRLQQAVDQLKSKVVGRGITRNGIERVAKLHGFIADWEKPDSLAIIGEGEIVELDITFDEAIKNRVLDLSLKLNYDDDQHVQIASADILKTQAGAHVEDLGNSNIGLYDFASNIEYLADLDRINVRPNCFQLVNNLSVCLHNIWTEEKKRMHWRNELHHLRKGAIGKPVMDGAPFIGLNVAYWERDRAHQMDAGKKENCTNYSSTSKDEWHARISCEPGSPLIAAPNNWLTTNILTEGQPGQNVLDANDHVFHPDWRDLSAGLAIKTDETKEESSMDLDKQIMTSPQPLNVHFTCILGPEVLVPLPVLTKLNGEINMIDIDPRKAVTYHQVLQRKKNAINTPSTEGAIEERWKRKLPCVDQDGHLSWCTQSYRLYSVSQDTDLWCYPISRTKFTHPRQLADLLPILRMHIVVWALLESMAKSGQQSEGSPESTQRPEKRKTLRRSNMASAATNNAADAILNIDVTLDVLSNPSKTTMEIFAPVKASVGPKARMSMLHLVVQTGLNGVIDVTSVNGTHENDLHSLKTKLGKMLTATEDVGMVVQWLVARPARH